MTLAYIFFSIVHVICLYLTKGNVPILLMTKILPIWILFFMLVESPVNTRIKNYGLFAIAFSSVGDALLELNGLFVFGLGSFLVAQIFYSISFSLQGKLHLIRAIPFYLVSSGIVIFLFPKLAPQLQIPVIIYVFFLTMMAWRASAREVNQNSYRLTLIGACVFLVSDSLIAFTRFAGIQIPEPNFWIMFTYYVAQYLIVKGIINVS
ncbi:MAG: lysoplasmalogenase [Leptospiraceae bacterium]|nr:lysoplasmalogenase [Leptospiraceae bacterium]